jgi:hypothetical protein
LSYGSIPTGEAPVGTREGVCAPLSHFQFNNHQLYEQNTFHNIPHPLPLLNSATPIVRSGQPVELEIY